jgi:ribose transport system permease protein
MTAATDVVTTDRPDVIASARQLLRRNAWSLALLGIFLAMLVLTRFLQPNYGAPQLTALAIAMLPAALAAVGQATVVISGGIDLSIASIIALTNVTAAVLMKDQSPEVAVLVLVGVLLLGLVVGATNGLLIVVTRVPDIVVTLAMSFVWAGATLLVLDSPGGGAAGWLKDGVNGTFLVPWLPKAFVVLVVVVAAIWIPLRRSMLGLSLYALGSNQLAAFRSGVSVGRTKVIAYALTGLFCAIAGLAITGFTGQGSPLIGPYTLQSVAAIVLGGVSLAGGRGGLAGPIIAVAILQLVRTDLTILSVSPSLSTAIQGAILIGVVLIGSVQTLRRTVR